MIKKFILTLIISLGMVCFEAFADFSVKDNINYLRGKTDQSSLHISDQEQHLIASEKARVGTAITNGQEQATIYNLTSSNLTVSGIAYLDQLYSLGDYFKLDGIQIGVQSNGNISVGIPTHVQVPNIATYTNSIYTNWVVETPVQMLINGTNIGPLAWHFPSVPYPFWTNPVGTYVALSISNRNDIKAVLGYWTNLGQPAMIFGFMDIAESVFYQSWVSTNSYQDIATNKIRSLVNETYGIATARYGTNTQPISVTVTNGTVLGIVPVFQALATTSQLYDVQTNLFLGSKDPTGWDSEESGSWNFNAATRTLTVSNSGSLWMNGVKYSREVVTATIGTNRGLWFVYYKNGETNITTSQTSWDLYDAHLATIYADTNQNYILGNEHHTAWIPWRLHRRFHSVPGQGSVYGNGLNLTMTTTAFSVSAGVIFDEDLMHSFNTTNRTWIVYRDGSSGYGRILPDRPTMFATNSVGACYDLNGVLTNPGDGGSANYFSMWLYCSGLKSGTPLIAVVGQSIGTLSTIEGEQPPSNLANVMIGDEAVLLYQVILRGNTPTFISYKDYRLSKVTSSASISEVDPVWSSEKANYLTVVSSTSTVQNLSSFLVLALTNTSGFVTQEVWRTGGIFSTNSYGGGTGTGTGDVPTNIVKAIDVAGITNTPDSNGILNLGMTRKDVKSITINKVPVLQTPLIKTPIRKVSLGGMAFQNSDNITVTNRIFIGPQINNNFCCFYTDGTNLFFVNTNFQTNQITSN